MEVLTLAGLVSLGYFVSRATEKQAPRTAKDNTKTGARAPAPRPFMAPVTVEAFASSPTELDMMFSNNGNSFPSEPVPGAKGLPTQYGASARPEAPTSQRPMVELRNDGVEESPVYVDGGYVVSPLTGQQIPTTDFTHNNMTPFFGGRVKQNMNLDAGSARLDTFTGSGKTQIGKREVEPMFDTAKPFGNPFGAEANTDFVQSRMEVTRSRAGEKPFEPQRIAPGVGEEGYGFAGKGGFQQMEVNEIMRNAMKTDELRTSDKPKLSYNSVVVPGKHYIGGAAESSGEVRQYHPDRYFENKDGERFFVTNGEIIKESVRPTQILNYTTRPETSQEYTGVAQSQDAHSSYITGSYRNPMTQQFGTDGFHNADLTSYMSGSTDDADYGRGGYENRPNERSATGERVMGLNLAPADTGATMIHYTDDVRPTRRAETIGNLRQAGMPVGYATGAPAVTVWDPKDIARTTVKEGTIQSNYYGLASSASAPTRLKVYDPDDIARPTQKAQLSAKEYFGAPMSSSQAMTSHEATKNARLNTSKQAAAKRRKPIAGNGGNMNLASGAETVRQRSRKLNADSINDREMTQTRVNGGSISAAELGRVKYRVPLENNSRIEGGIIDQLNTNPYNLSIHQIASMQTTP